MSRADRSAVSVPYETLTALPSKMSEPATRHSRPEGPERRERTLVRVVGASPTKGAADAIVSGRLRRGRTTHRRRESQPSPNRFSTEPGRSRNHERHAGCDRSAQARG